MGKRESNQSNKLSVLCIRVINHQTKKSEILNTSVLLCHHWWDAELLEVGNCSLTASAKGLQLQQEQHRRAAVSSG